MMPAIAAFAADIDYDAALMLALRYYAFDDVC